MDKLSQLKNYFWILIIGIILSYFVIAGDLLDLSNKDAGNFISNDRIRASAFADNVTFFSSNSMLSYFDPSLNLTINSTNDNSRFWRNVKNISIDAMLYSSKWNRVYVAGSTELDGNEDIGTRFAYFSPSLNTTINLTSQIITIFTRTVNGKSNSITAMTEDSARNLIFLGADIFSDDVQFYYGYWNASSNTSTDLKQTDSGGFFNGTLATNRITSMVHNEVNRTYMTTISNVAQSGSANFAYYDFGLNRTISLENNDGGNWLQSDAYALAFNPNSKRVYVGGVDGDFGYFDETLNATIQLDISNVSLQKPQAMAIDKNRNLTFFASEKGEFGYFDEQSNQTINLTGRLTPLAWGITSINSLSYDNKTNMTFIFGASGKYAVYGNFTRVTNSEPTIINNYTTPLTPTLDNPFNITAEINGTEIDDIIYANFSIQASNGTILLNNVNGTLTRNGNIFNYTSSTFIADDGGIWRWNYTTRDNASSTEVFRSGQFTISDSVSPILNITHLMHRLNPNNTNFSIDTTYRIQVNWTGTDNIRLNTMWYIFDHNSTNTTIPLYTNFTLSIPFAGRHNITLFANDTTGNIGSTFINFSVRNDTQIPTVTITSPSGTQTSQTITTNHSLSDDVAIYEARYSVYSGSTNNIANTTITNPLSNTTLIYTTTLGCSSNSYTLYLWANDTSGNEQQTSLTYTCTTSSPSSSGGGGGGGGSISCRNSGDVCTTDSDCCGGNLCSKDKGVCIGLPILLKSGEISILMSNERDTSDSYDIRLLKGKSATRIVKFHNNGTRTAKLNLICDDLNEEEISTSVCKWVTLEQDSITLLKDEKKEVKFTVQVPESVEYGDVYFFGIRAFNENLGIDNMLRSEVHIDPVIGFLFSLGEKISGSQIFGNEIAETREGAKPLIIKNWIILFSSLIFLSLISYFILNLISKKLLFKGWISFAIGLVITMILLLLL